MRGVNILGYFNGNFGLSIAARLSVAAMIGKIPLCLLNVDIGESRRCEPHGYENLYRSTAEYDTNLVHLNALEGAAAIDQHPQIFNGRRNVLVPFWELESVPDVWGPALDKFDAILAASEYMATAYRKATKTPVLPYPLTPNAELGGINRDRVRKNLGLNPDAFVFFAHFDTDSGLGRKNSLGVLNAFLDAFGDDPGVALLFKQQGLVRFPEVDAALKAAPDNVYLVDGYVRARDMIGLYAASDAYVSLHRAEGLGLGMMEAMQLGKPVIATGYSGNLDFMDESTGILIPYDKVPVKCTQDAYHARHFSWPQFWAEPDLDAATITMKTLAEHSPTCTRLAVWAKAKIDTRRTWFRHNAASIVSDTLIAA